MPDSSASITIENQTLSRSDMVDLLAENQGARAFEKCGFDGEDL